MGLFWGKAVFSAFLLMSLSAPAFAASQASQCQPKERRSLPGATGPGSFQRGGQCGELVHVTNLCADGPGSLRDALSLSNYAKNRTPRVVVFDVGGVIDLNPQGSQLVTDSACSHVCSAEFLSGIKSRLGKDLPKDYCKRVGTIQVDAPHLTVAGQTSPTTVKIRGGGLSILSDHVEIFNLAVRVGPKPFSRSPGGDNSLRLLGKNFFGSHLSASLGPDQSVGITGNFQQSCHNLSAAQIRELVPTKKLCSNLVQPPYCDPQLSPSARFEEQGEDRCCEADLDTWESTLRKIGQEAGASDCIALAIDQACNAMSAAERKVAGAVCAAPGSSTAAKDARAAISASISSKYKACVLQGEGGWNGSLSCFEAHNSKNVFFRQAYASCMKSVDWQPLTTETRTKRCHAFSGFDVLTRKLQGIDKVRVWADSDQEKKAAESVTLQDSVIVKGLQYTGHPEGAHIKNVLQGYGSTRIRFERDLFADSLDRGPMTRGGYVEVVNNLFYNHGVGAVLNPTFGATRTNIAGNSYVILRFCKQEPGASPCVPKTMYEYGPDGRDFPYKLGFYSIYLSQIAAYPGHYKSESVFFAPVEGRAANLRTVVDLRGTADPVTSQMKYSKSSFLPSNPLNPARAANFIKKDSDTENFKRVEKWIGGSAMPELVPAVGTNLEDQFGAHGMVLKCAGVFEPRPIAKGTASKEIYDRKVTQQVSSLKPYMGDEESLRYAWTGTKKVSAFVLPAGVSADAKADDDGYTPVERYLFKLLSERLPEGCQ